MIKMRKKILIFSRALGILIFVLCCWRMVVPSWALNLKKHMSTANQYVWGLTTEASRAIHSEIIDKVPWRNAYGGGNHRDIWGHSDAWFYEGKLPKEAVLQDISNSNPSFSDKEIQKIYRDATSMTGQERIALELRKQFPNLSQKEARAAAEQAHSAHIIGDSTTPSGYELTNVERAKSVLSSPSLEAVRAENKMAISKALENTTPEAFVGQPTNFERLKVVQIMEGTKVKGYNPAGRADFGFESNGQKYIYKGNASRARDALQRIDSNTKIVLPDDEYTKLTNNRKELAGRLVPESQLSGKTNTLHSSQTQLVEQVTVEKTKLVAVQKIFADAVRQKIKQAAPYAIGGALMTISENWDILDAAYQGEEEWEKALKRTGIDFTGYTITPMMIDGALAKAGNKVALMASLKNAGMGYTVGYFIWGAGKEYYAYKTGDIAYDELVAHIKKRGIGVASQTMMIPVNALVLKIVGGALAGPLIVPIVIIGGGYGVSYAFQRASDWYQNKIWEQTIYVEDVIAILGPDLVEEFTLATPEKMTSLAAPERRDSLAVPEEQYNLTNPEPHSNIFDNERYK
jgi:hypothetical protein